MGEFDIKQYCGEQTYMRLTQIAEQPAKQFMKGQATTAFSTVNTMAAGVNNVLNAYNTLTNTDYNELITTFSQQTWKFVKDQLAYYGKEEVSYITEKALTLPSYLAKRTTYWTTYWTKIEMANIMDELSNDVQATANKQKEDEDKKQTEENIKNFKYKTAYINNKVSQVTQNMYSYITTVTQYITTGPDWLQQNLQKTIKKTVDPLVKSLRKETTEQYNNVLMFLDGKADEAGHKIASNAAEKKKNQLKKAMVKADKLKKTAISFAKSALQLIKQKAMALIGA